MKGKKILLTLAALCVSVLTIGVVGCGETESSSNTGNLGGGNTNIEQSGNDAQDTQQGGNGGQGENSGQGGQTGGDEAVEKLESQGLAYELSADETYYVVTGTGTCTDAELVIPSTYNEKPVAAIGKKAFYGVEWTSVTLPNSVTSIGDSAFYDGYSGECENVYYQGSITAWCDITFDSSTASPMWAAKNFYLYNEDNGEYELLTELVIPDTVTEIKANTFYSFDSLTSVQIGNGVKKIDGNAFTNCDGVKSLTLGSGVKEIKGYAFDSCDGLLDVTIPDNVMFVGENAFYSCEGLRTVKIGNGVKTVGSYAFAYCDRLKSVEIGDSVVTVGSSAFSGCNDLIKVTLGESVTTIEANAFDNCYKLVEIYNKSDLTITAGNSYSNGRIGKRAKNIYTPTSGESKLATDENGYILYTHTVYGETNPLSTMSESYQYEEVWLMGYEGEETDLTLPASVTDIHSYAFYENDEITSVAIGDGVTSVGESAFNGCSNLEYIVIGNGVQSIASYSLHYCNKLNKIYYKGSVSEWEEIDNSYLYVSATIYYYVENEGDLPWDGNEYWHYMDGVPTAW